MPRSSSARELQIATKLTENLKQVATDEVIFSYPEYIDDQITGASRLIEDLSNVELNNINLNIYDNLTTNIYNSTENWANNDANANINSDNFGPKLQDKESLAAGSRILKLQSDCPFKAFSEIRLKAYPLEEPEFTINKAMKGEITHQALALFWEKIKTSKKLKDLSELEIKNLVNWILDNVLSVWKNKNYKLQDQYIKLEKQRLLNIILDWLELDKTREEFAVIEIEKKHTVKIGPLSLKLRVDRVDQIGNNHVLIDYKTNDVETSKWFGERPLEPQLPLYMISSHNMVVARKSAD